MPGLNKVTAGDTYDSTTPPATVQDVWNSRGGWIDITQNGAFLELQYGRLGFPYWLDEQLLDAGSSGTLPPNCTGFRVRNSVAGKQAIVSGFIAQGDEPALAIQNLGTVAVSGIANFTQVTIQAAAQQLLQVGDNAVVFPWQSTVLPSALAWFRRLSAVATNEYQLVSQIENTVGSAGGVAEHQAALFQALCAVNSPLALTTYSIAGALHAQAWINSGITQGLAQAGTFEALHVDATADGLLFALEATVVNDGTVVNSVDSATAKINYWGASKGTAAATAFLAMANNTGGWQLGLALRHVNSIFIRMLNPDTAGAVGIDMPNDANWGEGIRLPNTVALRSWNAAGSSRHNLALLSASDQVVLGSTSAPGGTFIQGGGAGGASFISILTAGLSIATTSSQKLGFYGVTPIVQAQLSTGVGHTVDDVITALQNLGLVHQ